MAGIAVCATPALAGRTDAWLDGVREFLPGAHAGFGADSLPGIVLGPPVGGGMVAQSTDVVSLGDDGTITVAFRDNLVFDGPGDDLAVYENAFHVGGESGPIFTEYATLELSADGRVWVVVPHDAVSGEGLAGDSPVLATPGSGIDPLSPEGGGDRFDIGAFGLEFVRFVRVTDGGAAIDDAGNLVAPANKGGFDLDAMGAIHSSPPAVVTGTVSASGLPVADARVTLVPSDGTRRLHRRSRADGTFRFRCVLPSGDVRVEARKAGLGSATAAANVALDRLLAHVDLTLE
jgi:hypothetical protein